MVPYGRNETKERGGFARVVLLWKGSLPIEGRKVPWKPSLGAEAWLPKLALI
jgi:hypothetical protein